jgi:hypothetical protein
MSYLFDFWPEQLLTKDEAHALLEPFFQGLVRCWREAWREWENLSGDFRGKLHPRDRAGILHSLAIAQAKLIFADVPGVQICQELGFFKLYIGDRAVLRLKRLGRDHLARNIKTKQQRKYYWHYSVAGVREGCTRLTVGYSLDVSGTTMEQVLVSLQIGLDNLLYSFLIESEPQIQTIPISPIPEDQKPKVRAKGTRKAKER